MSLFFEYIKFIFYGLAIIFVSKYILMWSIRKLSLLFNLRPSTTGKIEGYATSAPELISTIFAAYYGMIDTSTYNIISSNIINVIIFIFSIIIFKKIGSLKKVFHRFDYIIISLSILIPLILLRFSVHSNILFIPIFIFLFYLYLKSDKYINKIEDDRIDKYESQNIKKYRKTNIRLFSYSLALLFSIILLYFLGNNLGNVLNNLFVNFNIPQFVLGFLIGCITSLPELITFLSAQNYHNKYSDDNESNLGTIEALNNLISSNISNLLIIQTVGIIIFNIFK